MSDVFRVTIALGNEAMKDEAAVADALDKIAAILRRRATDAEADYDSGAVRDANGNKVGEWEIAPR